MFSTPKTIRRGQEAGVTLIEVLAVILIIGILAAIAIPMFLNQRAEATDASVKADVRNAESSLAANQSSPAHYLPILRHHRV